jgi:hypothetical protein
VLYLDTKKEIIDLVKESQEFIIKNNNNKINQTDEMLNCDDYLYDYIKEQEIKKQKEEELKRIQEEKEQYGWALTFYKVFGDLFEEEKRYR